MFSTTRSVVITLFSLGAVVFATLLLLQRNGDPTFATTESDRHPHQQDTPQPDGGSAKDPARVEPSAVDRNPALQPAGTISQENDPVRIPDKLFPQMRGQMWLEVDVQGLRLPTETWQALIDDWNDYTNQISLVTVESNEISSRISDQKRKKGEVEKYHVPPPPPPGTSQEELERLRKAYYSQPHPWDHRPGEWGGQYAYYDKESGQHVIEVVRILQGESLELDRNDARIQELKAIRLQRARALITRYQ